MLNAASLSVRQAFFEDATCSLGDGSFGRAREGGVQCQNVAPSRDGRPRACAPWRRALSMFMDTLKVAFKFEGRLPPFGYTIGLDVRSPGRVRCHLVVEWEKSRLS